ncbi:MAG TPA: hypothetical protein VNE21_04420 [Mycobacteriales bacterium]|nr:hypothetical protein [Mycobacteriales bacterium]
MKPVEIDRRYLPQAAAALRRLLRVLDRLRRALVRRSRRLSVLTSVRTNPYVGLGALALVVGTVIITSTVLHGGSGSGLPPVTQDVSVALGPRPGDLVSEYLTAADSRLRKAARGSGSAERYAVIDLSGYRTVAAVARLLAGVEVDQVFYHVPSNAPTQSKVLAVRSLADVLAAFRTTADVDRRTAVVISSYLAGLPRTTLAERRTRAILSTQLAVLRAEARMLGPACACLYGLLVRAPVRELVALAGSADVRVVDPAPKNALLSDLDVAALLPGITGRVPATQAIGGGVGI